MERRRTLVSPVLVGRDDLLDLAGRRIDQVAAGTGHALLIAGEAGLGKTRLLGAIKRRAAAAGFAVLAGGTYPSDLQVAGAVLLDLARAMQRAPDSADLGARLEARLDAGAVGMGDGHRRRRLLVLDVAELLVDAARDAPALVALEDLHWSDDLTLEILEAVARRLEDVPLLLAGTYRSDELFPRVPLRHWRARLVAQRLAEEVRLRRLTSDETASMATLLSGAALPTPRDVAEAIHRRSDGIPLHVEELMAVLAEEEPGALAPAADREVRRTGPDRVAGPAQRITSATVPDTLEAAVSSRIERRTRAAVAVAQAGAVIGRSFDVDLLASVIGESPDLLAEPLAELAAHFLLVPAAQPGRYGFRHSLICDVIYDGIPVTRRRELHDRTAVAAQERPDVGTDAFLAIHYERAGRREAAFEAALRGATAAAALSSHTEARALYAIALDTAPADLPPLERARLLEAYAVHAAATDANETAADAFEAARAAYREGGDPLAAAAIVAPLTGVRHLLGDDLEARSARIRAAFREIGSPPPLHSASADPAADRVRARLLAELSAAYMLDRRLDESMAYALEARRFANLVGDEAIDRHAATTLGSCEVFAGRMDDGWTRLEEATQRCRTAELEADAARGYRMLGSSASVLVEYDRAERWLREGIAYAEGVELWNHRHYMAAHLAHVLWATGRWAEADSIARHALADGRGGMTTRITALHVLGYLALGRDDRPAAVAALDEALGLGRAMRELQRLSPAMWGLAELASVTGDPASAVRWCEGGFRASAAVADAAYLFPYVVTGARSYLAVGDPAGARDWLERTSRALLARGIPGTLAAIPHARGLIALADGRTALAREELQSAADAWRQRGRVWEGTWASVDLARAYQRANLTNQARATAKAAAETARTLGSSVLERAADEVTRSLRSASADPWAPLSAREFEVARLVADGRTNAAIGQALDIAPKTVSAHIEHILAKLDMERRAEIAAWAAERAVLHSRPHGDDREE
jgi:DNA-binding CsgD family transcriptional regulator